MKKIAMAAVCLLIFCSMLSGGPVASADSSNVQNAYSGIAYINGTPAKPGYTLIAYVNNAASASTTIGANGSYGPLVITGVQGAAITFSVNGITATTTSVLVPGDFTTLDIHFTKPYTYYMLGQSGNLSINNGVMQVNQVLSSGDGRIALSLGAGTAIDMRDQYQITAAGESNPPAAADNSTAFRSYSLQPNGLTFSPNAILSLGYAGLPATVNSSTLYIAWWNTASSTWQPLTSTSDNATLTVSAPVSHFTVFSLRYPPQASSASDNTTTTATGSDNTTASQAATINTNVLGTSSTFTINNGAVPSAVSLAGSNGQVVFSLAAATAVNMQGGQNLSIVQLASPPAASGNVRVIGAYSCGPANATFNPAATLSIRYTAADLPSGISEDSLYIAELDGMNWIPLTSSAVDTAGKLVTARISHFSAYGLLGTVSTPATPPAASTPPTTPVTTPPATTIPTSSTQSTGAFVFTDMAVSPETAAPDKPVSISVRVSNGGSSEETHNVALTINGSNAAQEEVTLAPGKSRLVTFSIKESQAGKYTASAGSQTVSFEVKTGAASGSTSGIAPLPLLLVVAATGLLVVFIIMSALRRRQD